MQRHQLKVGFAINCGSPLQDRAASLMTEERKAGLELEATGAEIGDWALMNVMPRFRGFFQIPMVIVIIFVKRQTILLLG